MKQPPRSVVPVYPLLASWFLIPGAVVLFALTLTGGLIAKSYGVASPELALVAEASQTRSPVLDIFSLGINYGLAPLAAVTILVAISGALILFGRKPLKALAFFSITSVGWLSSEVGKLTVSRPRPPTEVVNALITTTGLDSFPSGHTAFAASIAFAVVLVVARRGFQRRLATIAGVCFAVAVGLSRVYLGVHYPTDVIGSLFISAAGILLWLPLWNNLIEPRLRRSGVLLRFSSQTEETTPSVITR